MIRASTHLQYANGYLELGMVKEARAELAAIDDADRDCRDYRLMMVKLHLETRQWKRMEVVSKSLVEIDPEDVFGWVNWAYALRELNRTLDAKSVAEKGVALHPDEAVLWFNLACYCSLIGEVEDASNHLDRAISIEKSFEAESVDDPDLDNLWNWIRGQESSESAEG